MKKHIHIPRRVVLAALALLLSSVAVQVKGQTQSDFDNVFDGGDRGTWTFKGNYPEPLRTVYLIKEGTSAYTKDANGNAYTVPSGVGYMKFEIVDGEARVYSSQGLNSGNNTVAHYGTDGTTRTYTEYGISNKDFNGTLTLPSQVKLTDGTTDLWYDVTTIQIGAFIYLPIQAINIESSTLKLIGGHAFEQSKKDNSYTKVTIKTQQALIIDGRAFGNSSGTVYIDDNYASYADENRTCLANVVIEAAGLDINNSAFVDCEALETVDITSTGIINIGEKAFGADGFTTNFEDAGKAIPITKLLPRMWDRDGTTDAKGKNDHIYINGPINKIDEFAFSGHQNIKHIRLIDPRKNNDTGSMTIGTQAFQNAFNGKGVEGTLTIEGPITSIGDGAFWNYLYYNNIVVPANGSQEEKDRIESGQYQDCLTHVRISNTGNDGLTTTHFLPEHFIQTTDNTAKATLKIEGPITKIGYRAVYTFDATKNTIGGSRLREIIIDNKNLNNASATVPDMEIDNYAFYNSMTSNLPDQAGQATITGPMKSIGTSAFGYCAGLNDVTISNTGNTDLTIGNTAFQKCYQYESRPNGVLTISGPLAKIGNSSFQFAGALKTATITNTGSTQTVIDGNAFQTSYGSQYGFTPARSKDDALFDNGVFTFEGPLYEFGSYSFNMAVGLKTLNIKSETEFRIKDNAFTNARSLCELNYDNGTEQTTRTLPSKLKYIGGYAFRNTAFTEMTIPYLELPYSWNQNKSYYQTTPPKQATVDGTVIPADNDAHDVYNNNDNMGYGVFQGCKSLEKVTIHSTTTGRGAFMGCDKLESVTLGSEVKFIESAAFGGCNSLKELFVPRNVEVIGRAIMYNQTGQRITFEAEQPPYAFKQAFATNVSYTTHAVNIIVPKGCVSSYLFTADDLGFQNVDYDNISCEYKLADGANWGSIGMQPHTIKEYEATIAYVNGNSTEATYNDGKVGTLKVATANGRGTFTDIYDTYRIGVDEPAHVFEEDGEIYEHKDYSTMLRSDPAYDALYEEFWEKVSELEVLYWEKYDKGEITYDEAVEQFTQAMAALEEEYKPKWDELEKRETNFNVYTADYYYPETQRVGLDKIQKGAIVPQNTSTTNRNIGYLFAGPVAGGTYFFHHYTGGESLMEHKMTETGHTYTIAGYEALVNEAKTRFDSEDIPCPGVLRESKNGGNAAYSRSTAPNLLVAWDEAHTGYAQGSNFEIGSWFGTKACYYYGYDPASDKFRRLSANTWAKMKEGLAFLAVPKELIDAAGTGNATLGKLIIGGDDDNETTGIKEIKNEESVMKNVDAWYTLDGRRLNARPTQRGIYIHNGRKEAIR